ncbi:MAG TPA: hypothetical protein VMC03_14810 [Streptosporangiaceae bacterium]|nr:hypothetical protein [Streptosporangiaceae bacterium]
MTGMPGVTGPAQDTDPPDDGWRAAAPEICIAAVVVAVAAAAGYAAAGLPGVTVVVLIAAAVALLVLRVLAPPAAAPQARRPADAEALPATFTGYWRKRSGLADATGSMTAYDAELRGTLQHLLAARLAERHGVSLRDDPDAARRLLCSGPRDGALWYWIDPARPPVTKERRSGIPPRTLARLLDRLERL